MGAIDVPANPDFGLRAEQGGPPAASPLPSNDGGEAFFGAVFRQTNTLVSTLHYLRNQGHYAPVPGYNPVTDIKGWGDSNYFLNHGDAFVGSQSPAETLNIKRQIDEEEADRRLLAANGGPGIIATIMSGILDPINFLPGGIGIDAGRGSLTFSQRSCPE